MPNADLSLLALGDWNAISGVGVLLEAMSDWLGDGLGETISETLVSGWLITAAILPFMTAIAVFFNDGRRARALNSTALCMATAAFVFPISFEVAAHVAGMSREPIEVLGSTVLGFVSLALAVTCALVAIFTRPAPLRGNG